MIGEICKKCGGSGVILTSEVGTFGVYMEPREIVFTEPCPECRGGHEGKVEKVRHRANIPPAYYEATLEAFDWNGYEDDKGKVDLSLQKKFVDSFVNDFEKWQEKGLGLYIYSSIRGTGKTFLASCICNELMKQKALVSKFVSASELIKMDHEDAKTNFEKSQIETLCECSLLVIDDLGQQKSGENWLDDILFRIIDYRYQHRLVTCITSNIELKRLRLDDRVSDRLNDMCQNLPLPEVSYRQKESVKTKKEFFKDLGLM